MSIVNTDPRDGPPQPPRTDPPVLEVVVSHARDVAGADEGGADRLMVVVDPDSGGLSPEPALVSAICRETELPVRAMLRLERTYTVSGASLHRLIGLGEDYLASGAQGVSFGFLDADLNVDVEVCTRLATALEAPWTFHRALDASLETTLAWRRLRGLPGLDCVLSAGSVRGLEAGAEELTDRAAADPWVAGLLMAAGGLRGEHVPWLVRAGVHQFQVARSVRPGATWKSHVEASHVRAWRMLLDDAADLAAGRPAE